MLYPLLILNLICTVIPLSLQDKKKGLLISISILFLFLALRYNFGNDYPAYYRMFYSHNLSGFLDAKIEYGYALLCTIFKPLGFFSLIIFWSAFYCLTLYKTIRRYIPPQYYWLVIMSIISNADLVFFGASAIRQTLAFSCILFILPYLEAKKPIHYALGIVIASLFHQSALMFIALYPLMYLKLQNKTFIIIFGLIVLAFITILKSQFESIVNLITASYFEKYIDRYGDSEQVIEGGLAGTIIRMIFLFLFLWSMKFETNKIKSIFFILAVIGIVIFTMRNSASLQRFTLYFGYMMAFSFSYVLEFIKKKSHIFYILVMTILLAWNINMAITFASQPESSFEYITIFESDKIYIPL